MRQKIEDALQLITTIQHIKDCPALDGAGCQCGYSLALTYLLNCRSTEVLEANENKFL